jgi:uncharacterized protein (TIGR03437 family)
LLQKLLLLSVAGIAVTYGQSASLVGSYTFQNTLSPAFGATPELIRVDPQGRSGYITDTVLGQQRTVYQFLGTPTEQAGLSLELQNVVNPLTYSFEMLFALTEGNGTNRRVYDNQNRESDRGIYINARNLFEFSRLSTGTATYASGQYVHLLVSISNNEARLYVNGVRDIRLGTNSMNITSPRGIVSFFLDNLTDTSTRDYSSGKIALLRIYTNAISDAEAAALGRDPFGTTVGVGPPSFLSNGVRNGATFGETTPIAPGAFFSIFGSSLSAGTGDWSAAFVDGQAPRRLNGTRVLINDQEAFLVFTSTGQINALAPDTIPATGTLSVRVERDGVASTPVNVNGARLNPAFFLYDQRNRRYIATLSADNTAYIAPRDLFGVSTLNGLQVRPARPGEFVIAYGMGMGATTPATAVGRIPTPREGGYPVSGTVSVQYGPRTITPLYVGLSGFAGVYLVGFQVPDLADGDYELNISINGIRSPTGGNIPIAR